MSIERTLDCGCIIRLVEAGSFVFGLCDLHEAYPDWLDADDHWDLYDEMEEENAR